MKVIESENIIMFDVDDTLACWDDRYMNPGGNKLEFISVSGTKLFLTPHKKHIELLKDHFNRGYTVFVWSAGGYEWAREIVCKLELQDYVHYVMSKPGKFVDDLQAHEILGTRIYLKDANDSTD